MGSGTPAGRGPGDYQQILDWPKDYIDADRLGGVDEFISWIGRQEHCVVNPRRNIIQSVLLPGWILANASLIRGWLGGKPLRSLPVHVLNLVLSFKAA